MNYITSCPKCDTRFLLQTEHLKAHRGKVQCGHCEHVFNAKNRLTEISDDIQSPEEYQASLEHPISENELPTTNEADVYDESSPIDEIEITASPTYIGEFSPSVAEPIVIEDLTADPKFSRKKIKLNIWFSLASLVLLMLAGLQTAYFMRTKLAAEYPQYKPLLVKTCSYLHCEIPLPKDLDLLAIDDSDMQEDENYQGVINFSSALINNAGYIQTFPNIELTLTNKDDQPVLRRLITPREYLDAETKINDGMAAHEEVRIKLAIHASDVAVAGYRVLLVY
jgi:predicted Zn finger-like uncharacterized protein